LDKRLTLEFATQKLDLSPQEPSSNLPLPETMKLYQEQSEARKQALKDLSDKDGWLVLYSVIVPEVFCKDLVRIGTVVDGGKWVCNPVRINDFDTCVVYSLGIRNEVSFEQEFARFTYQKCLIRSLDKNAQESRTLNEIKKSNGIFMRALITSETNKSMNHYNMKSLMEFFDDKKIDILKVDIEGFEYTIVNEFTTIPICQILIEVHGSTPKKTLELLQKISQGGYYLYSYEINGGYPTLMMVTGAKIYMTKRLYLARHYPIITGVCIFATYLIYSCYSDEETESPLASAESKDRIAKPDFTFSSSASEGDSNDECKLIEADPYDAEILPFITFDKKHCIPKNPTITRLENAHIIIKKNNYLNLDYSNCFTRCHTAITEKLFQSSEWEKLFPEKEIPCDIVEVQCYYQLPSENNFDVEKAAYWNIHVQVYKKQKSPSYNEIQRPSVHIFLLDSVSHPEMIRSLPKTLTYLKEKFNIISFPFHSLNGKISHHNGFATLFGKNVFSETTNEGIYPSRPVDYKNFTHYLDEDQYIGKIFQSAGYITALCETSYTSVFAKFEGFRKLPADHVCNPAGVILDGEKKNIFIRRCDRHHGYQFKYLESFAKEYEGRPKFSLSWNTQLAHESLDGIYPHDDMFLEFFQSIEKEVENSYFILMADHGPRYGDFRETSAGHRENLNPALFITLPKSIRENHPEVVNIVKQNSRKMTTHYDLFATLVEIADSKDPKFLKEDLILYGKSLLKPLEKERSCRSLMILPDLCLCETPKTTVTNKSFVVDMTNFAISKMNDITTPIRNICYSLELDTDFPPRAEQVHFPKITEVKLYKLQFRTTPGTGRFWTFIIKNRKGEYSIMGNIIHRGSARKPDVFCDPPFAPNFCPCRRLEQKNKSLSLQRYLFG
ncbi:hypothetical protein FO519_009562, partial [Halicephalobus sp. NKZ332]